MKVISISGAVQVSAVFALCGVGRVLKLCTELLLSVAASRLLIGSRMKEAMYYGRDENDMASFCCQWQQFVVGKKSEGFCSVRHSGWNG